MEKKLVSLPLYSKLAQIIVALLAFFYILYIGKGIIVPFVFSTILAILLNPVVNFMTKRGMNRVLAIITVLILAIVLVAGIGSLIGSQVAMFSESVPQLKEKFTLLFSNLRGWVSTSFNVDQGKIDNWVNNVKTEGVNSLAGVAGQTLGAISGGLIVAVLIPIYVFMILFYKTLLLGFIARLFKNDQHSVVNEVLNETKSLIQSYLIGLLIEAALVATLNSIGLLVIGVQYAILLGVLGALLNIIPYIGGVIAIAMPMLIAFATKSPISALWVLIVYSVIQFIDNNIIVPRIVASKVKINGIISIIVVLFGGELWGVAGMFLSIPLTAIIKVIFDRMQGLEAFGYLLGDNMEDENTLHIIKKHPKKRNL